MPVLWRCIIHYQVSVVTIDNPDCATTQWRSARAVRFVSDLNAYKLPQLRLRHSDGNTVMTASGWIVKSLHGPLYACSVVVLMTFAIIACNIHPIVCIVSITLYITTQHIDLPGQGKNLHSIALHAASVALGLQTILVPAHISVW